MKITVICSDPKHIIFPYLEDWKKKNYLSHEIIIVNSSKDITSGDILFLISCTEIITSEIRNRFSKTLLIHESDLPKGRGWSPLQWLIVEGVNRIPLTLLEALDKVDSGPIWAKRFVDFEGHELVDEITLKIFTEKINLLDFAINNFNSIIPEPQSQGNSSYYPRRFPKDSEIDVNRSISEQFNKIRIADEVRYPCFFKFKDYKYKILLRKISNKEFDNNYPNKS